MAKYIDLHTHTYHSDGALSPSQLVEKAKSVGLAAIAISDHDSVDGLIEGIAAGKKLGVEIIPGVEITSYPNEKQDFHLLGYFIDWKNKQFQKILADSRKTREERAKKVVDNLVKLGFQINFGDLRAMTRGTIVTPHIAWLVINDQENKEKLKKEFGGKPTTGEFIVKYLIPGALAYESRQTLKPKEAISLIHRFGGIVVLAHPCWSITKKDGGKIIFDDKELEKVINAGIDGIEIYAHRENEVDTRLCVEHFGKIAKNNSLLATGGSDFHGFGSAGKSLGFSDFYLKVPYSVLKNLKLRIKKNEK